MVAWESWPVADRVYQGQLATAQSVALSGVWSSDPVPADGCTQAAVLVVETTATAHDFTVSLESQDDSTGLWHQVGQAAVTAGSSASVEATALSPTLRVVLENGDAAAAHTYSVSVRLS